jgi:hypothetical protein
MIARLIQVAWEIGAVALIVGTILTVRKARARGKRLFADEPAARVDALKHDTTNDHIWDAM